MGIFPGGNFQGGGGGGVFFWGPIFSRAIFEGFFFGHHAEVMTLLCPSCDNYLFLF